MKDAPSGESIERGKYLERAMSRAFTSPSAFAPRRRSARGPGVGVELATIRRRSSAIRPCRFAGAGEMEAAANRSSRAPS
jgi:hypothetical protein